MNSVGGGGGGGIDLDKQRDRNRRGERGTRFSDNKDNEDRDRSRERPTGDGSSRRVYVSNIPYEYRWQDLKDLFRRMVGSVSYVELFLDENNKARGCGIVEFKDPENVAKAMEVMHRHNLNGREIVVKEDHGEQRDKYGRIERGGGGGGGGGGGSGGGGSSLDNARNSGRGNQGGRDRDDDRYSLVFIFIPIPFVTILFKTKSAVRCSQIWCGCVGIDSLFGGGCIVICISTIHSGHIHFEFCIVKSIIVQFFFIVIDDRLYLQVACCCIDHFHFSTIYRCVFSFSSFRSMNSGGNNKNNSLGLNNYDQQDTSYNTYGLSPSFLASLRIQGPLHNKVFVANVSIIIRQMIYNQSNSPNKSLFSPHLCSHTLFTPPLSLCHSFSSTISLSVCRRFRRASFVLHWWASRYISHFLVALVLSLVVPFSSVQFLANNSI